MVYEILINEIQKVSSARESQELLDSYYDENNIYQVERISLEETKGNLNGVSVHFNANRKFHIGLKIKMI